MASDRRPIRITARGVEEANWRAPRKNHWGRVAFYFNRILVAKEREAPMANEKQPSRFRRGQVVALIVGEGRGRAFGEFVDITSEGRFTIRFWDFDKGDWWQWDYERRFVRRLNRKERP